MSKWTRLEWIGGVKIRDKVFCMVKFCDGKPREFVVGVFVTKPLNKV